MGKYSFADRAARKDPMSQEEALKTIEDADTLPLRALFAILWIWGPRINEAIRLQKRDFTIFDKSIRVRMPLSKKGDPQAFHMLRAGISTPGIAPLLEYLQASQDGRLFPMSIRTVGRKLHRINPNTSPHWFRHTRATRLSEETDNVLELVDWFGWADARPAMAYVQMSGKLAARLSDKVK